MEIAHEVSCTHTSYRPAYSVFSSTSSTVSSTPSASASSASSSLLSTPHASSLSSPNLRWQATVPMLCERAKVVARPSESAALLPLTWDIAVTIYQELVRLIHRLPFHKRLVVCLVYRGVKFRLDLGEGESIIRCSYCKCQIGIVSLGKGHLQRKDYMLIQSKLTTA
ncbi:hypothetical protein PoB_005592200 [Plakobranchus ocellatus]|uniref:Uncharacterized protein n=1 Tax=Plakobranchus ocellatus TaxID=259542 RepID=A0AAV4CDZ8_9GAST|nr:hypothetical protein PoB_005592200 [Plakobranchus ocellatus]